MGERVRERVAWEAVAAAAAAPAGCTMWHQQPSSTHGVYDVYQPGFSMMLRKMTPGVSVPW